MSKQIALDTNAYRAIADNNQKVLDVLHGASSVGLPIIVLGELYYGFENGNQKATNLNLLHRFLEIKSLQVLNINNETAQIFGGISSELNKACKPIQQNDIWIAALCKQYGYSLLSADKGFQHVAGLEVVSF